jgi:hypothetical protein
MPVIAESRAGRMCASRCGAWTDVPWLGETLAAQHDGDTAGTGTTRDRSLRVLDRRPASLAHRTVLSVPIQGVPRWLTTRRINVRSHASQDA